MSDTQSIADSTVSKQSNRNKMKICAYCGKQENSNWSRHFQTQHKGLDQKEWKEWVKEEPLKGKPYCENWEDVIFKGAKPINVLPQQKRGRTTGSSVCSRSDIGNDAEEEEKKKKELKENNDFGALADQSKQSAILGKRSSPEDQQQLEGAVNEELQQEQSAPNDSGSTDSSKPKPTKPTLGSVKRLNTQQNKVAEYLQSSAKDQEFKVPLPVTQTIYVDQGMRDREVIQKLKVLEKNTSKSLFVRVAELLHICSYFQQQLVCSYVEQNKNGLSHVKDLLLEIQQNSKELSEEKISSIAFVSFLFGGSVWTNLSNMLASINDADKFQKVLDEFSQLLSVKLNNNLAIWVCSHWRYLEEQTLTLLRYLKEQTIKEDLTANIATISIAVKITNVCDFFIVAKVFSEFPAFNLMLEILKASIESSKSIQKLTFDEFGVLITELMHDKNQLIIETNKDMLVKSTPLTHWFDKVKSLQEASLIQNIGSVQERLDYLGEKYGHLSNKDHKVDLYCNDMRYKRIMHEVANPPNELQFANAQYASFVLNKHSKQLWCIPSGQGKSRVLATIALILLLTKATSKVHLVFDSQHLMQRDQNDFAQWWQLASLEANIQYHVGFDDFNCEQGEIILIDEADEFIFSDPVKFIGQTQQFKCICLTATPDNNDQEGVEREVLQKLGFSIFNGQAAAVPQDNGLIIDHPSSLASEIKMGAEIENEEALVAFIKKKIEETAVVVYCSEKFEELLNTSDLEFLSMKKDREDIDDNFLRTLDKRDESKKTHALIVMTSLFGMRGFDYRAPSKGITLVIASSFSNERHKQQGLCRVGRFGDPCSRILLKGIALIDTEQNNKYRALLLYFLNQYSSTKQVVLKLSQQKEEKKKTTDSSSLTKVQPQNKRQGALLFVNGTATAVDKEENKKEEKKKSQQVATGSQSQVMFTKISNPYTRGTKAVAASNAVITREEEKKKRVLQNKENYLE